jgi:N6-adenosine-specific RNA methylase IME4
VSYEIILADPPWDFEVWNRDTGGGRSPSAHYDTMDLDAICALPVAPTVAAENCALFLWAVWPRIFDARRVIEAWGFSYKTLAWEWLKLNPSGIGLKMGMGYYTRANPEPCLLAVRGRMPVAVRNERNVLIAPAREHSRKPDEQYDKIGRLYPYAQGRLELFARQQWPGWDVWGNEVESTVRFFGP